MLKKLTKFIYSFKQTITNFLVKESICFNGKGLSFVTYSYRIYFNSTCFTLVNFDYHNLEFVPISHPRYEKVINKYRRLLFHEF